MSSGSLIKGQCLASFFLRPDGSDCNFDKNLFEKFVEYFCAEELIPEIWEDVSFYFERVGNSTRARGVSVDSLVKFLQKDDFWVSFVKKENGLRTYDGRLVVVGLLLGFVLSPLGGISTKYFQSDGCHGVNDSFVSYLGGWSNFAGDLGQAVKKLRRTRPEFESKFKQWDQLDHYFTVPRFSHLLKESS